MTTAQIGVFGGSGFYSLAADLAEHTVDTPYGPTSGPVSTGEIGGRPVAFMPRHGPGHELPAHAINYRANLWAFRELGVSRVIAPAAAGSLQPRIEPGHVVVCDQLVDRTSGRASTFYDGPVPVHIAFADPYCPALRPVASAAVRREGMTVHESGTVVVVQGPRFSTRAESAYYRRQGWEVVNMTQHPEAALARELELCYVNLSLITDYDTGVGDDPDAVPVTMGEVFRVFRENVERLRRVVHNLVEAMPGERDCACGSALEGTPLRP